MKAKILVISLLLSLVLAGLYAASRSSGIVLMGSGSSFIYPQMSIWLEAFHEEYPNITINYNPTGSGAGQTSFFQGVVDFAGSDPPLSRARYRLYAGRVLQVPVIAGAVVVVYNIPGLEGRLRVDGEVLAGIYLGRIEYWDDPLLKSLNPDLALPHERIVAVHRSDASGTTNVFTYFLHKAAPSCWPQSLVGKSIEWPVDSTGRGVGGKGNPGVVEQIRNTPYSIGYVELSYALKYGLETALVRNAEGVFVEPSPETVQEAAAHALEFLPDSPDADWSNALDAIVYAPGNNSYPISSFSFLFFWKHYDEEGKAWAVKVFLHWLAEKGYGEGMIAEGYVSLPSELRLVIERAAEMVSGG